MNQISKVRSWPVILLVVVLFSFIFVIANTPLEIAIQQCTAEDAESTSSGTWGTLCDNTYPGPALFGDDTTYEIHQVRKQGGSRYWAGLRINATNSSIVDCQSIEEVHFCYKWWAETDAIENCDISVDANRGTSYTPVTTTCPTTTEPGSVTCTDVTALELWTCDSFFGSGAFAKSEVQHSGTGGNGFFDITWDVFYFNVTYSNETAPPEFTNLANLSISVNETLLYDINATDVNGISCFTVNDTTHFTINCSGHLTNATGLANRTYWLNITVNNTLGVQNSGIMSVNVSNVSSVGSPSNGSDFEIENVPIHACTAEDAESTSPGTWGSVCDNSYPGQTLFNDDTTYEIHQVRKQAADRYWAGLRINATNTSVTDCRSIEEVYFCYKWWAETDAIENCDISVDANRGTSYTPVTTTCPATAEPGTITCTDVTSLEIWTCDAFFGDGAFAKSEVQQDGTGPNAFYNITWDVFYFNVTYSNETVPINISDITPNGSTAGISDTIEIGATVTANSTIDSVYIEVTFPNASVIQNSLSPTGNRYNVSFVIPSLFGRYDITFVANDSVGNRQTETTFFVAEDPIHPTIVSSSTVRSLLFTEQINIFFMDATDNLGVDSCWANITLPDMSVQTVVDLCNPPPTQFSNTSQIGTYVVTFFVNDTFGNVNSAQGSFDVGPKIRFKLTFNATNASNGINITIFKRGKMEVIYTNSSGGFDTDLPESLLDFEFKSFGNRLKTRLQSINLTTNNNKSFRMDKHFQKTDALVTYGVNNTYNFSNATITLQYDDVPYEDESNLQLLKCDTYNFSGRSCLSTWNDISSTATQNLSADFFEFIVTSFSAFSIEEFFPPPAQSSGDGSGGGGGGGGGGSALASLECGEWSECVDGEQTRECTQYDVTGVQISTQTVRRECIPLDDLNESQKRIKKLFDITLIVDELLNDESGLNAIVLLENFAATPLSFELNFSVFNAAGQEIFHELQSVIVEDMVWREYSPSEKLPFGTYTVTVEAIHNTTLRKKVIKEVDIGPQGFLSRSKQLLEKYTFLNWINAVGVIIVVIITVSYLYFNREAYKRKFREK